MARGFFYVTGIGNTVLGAPVIAPVGVQIDNVSAFGTVILDSIFVRVRFQPAAGGNYLSYNTQISLQAGAVLNVDSDQNTLGLSFQTTRGELRGLDMQVRISAPTRFISLTITPAENSFTGAPAPLIGDNIQAIVTLKMREK